MQSGVLVTATSRKSIDINCRLNCKCELEKTNNLKDSFGIESNNSFGIREV